MDGKMKPNMEFGKDIHCDRFTYSSNYAEDYICKNISFEAWGIFHKMLSLPPTWHFDQEIFAKMYNITTSKLRKNLKLLKQHGFLKMKRETLPNGQKGIWYYTLDEQPECIKILKTPQKDWNNPNSNTISIADFQINNNKKNVV